MSLAPNVAISPVGKEPAVDMIRLLERVDRIKLVMKKPALKAERRNLLQSELDNHMEKLGELKAMLNDL